MNNGFVSVGAAVPNIKIAHPSFNIQEHIALSKKAEEQGVSILVFPELSLCGVTCGNLFYQERLLQDCENAIALFLEETKNLELMSFIGAPLYFNGMLFNTTICIHHGKILGIVPKTLLENKEVFHTPLNQSMNLTYCGEQVSFGTDLLFSFKNFSNFNIGVAFYSSINSPTFLSNIQSLSETSIFVCPGSCNALDVKSQKDLCTTFSKKIHCAIIVSNPGLGESTTDYVYSGSSYILEDGVLLNECVGFEKQPLTIAKIEINRINALRLKDVDTDKVSCTLDEDALSLQKDTTEVPKKENPFPFIPKTSEELENILRIQSYGLAMRMERAHSSKLVLGISGGLDSTLAMLVSIRSLEILKKPHADLLAISMPCFGTTNRTKSNAQKLSELFGCTFKVIDIKKSVLSHFEDIQQDKDHTDAAFENAQARERTQVLMDISNQVNGLVVGTGDLSELALGWATYNGDHMSMYAVNASIPKTLVRALVSYEASLNENVKDILVDVLNTPVSPELLPPKQGEINQKTEDLVGPYELHDFFIYYFVKFGYTPKKIYALACSTFDGVFDCDTIRKWLKVFIRRFFTQQFKRSCMPDGPKATEIDFSPRGEWNMPSDVSSELWLEEEF